MMRSMYSGVSGLKNHQTRMDVIGNNIANINTNGYKKSRVVFQDTLYQKMRGATSPVEGGRGGTNPMAVGLGMAISSIDQIHAATATTSTNKLTDMAIDGDGYFVLKNGQQTYFTRAGNFGFDEMGMLTNISNGYNVQGWMADSNQTDAAGDWPISIVPATTETINISGFKACRAQATTESEFAGNLNSASVFNEIQLLSF
ncbi:MAG: flagellar hook-basal body complex protein [Syntrophomonadaceae bacterium]|nr:flagellar hook-basal body complex protein [Syntrophomonadaceae bacterium]